MIGIGERRDTSRIVQTPRIPSEPIVVQGIGMERWLAMELSRRLGVWADPWFPFPRRLLERAFAVVLPRSEEGAVESFEPARLTFVVAAALAENLTQPGFETLRRYVERGDRDDRILELSVRIAEAFDRYAVYRQDLILRWDAGTDDGWEARLWRAVTARIGKEHLPARAQRFLQTLHDAGFRLHINGGLVSPQPLWWRQVNKGMDMRLYVSGFRP